MYGTPAPSTEGQHPEAWPASTYGHLRGVPDNKKLLSVTLPDNKKLLSGTLPENNLLLKEIQDDFQQNVKLVEENSFL